MKRSEINRHITEAVGFFRKMKFLLPDWAYFSPEEWRGRLSTHREIVDNMLGWDITDFSGGDFLCQGLTLFTLRNGNPAKDSKPYAEKIMMVREEQVTPMHFHFSKMEDIINRGGGNLVMELYGSTKEGKFSKKDVTFSMDGVRMTLPAGGKAVLSPGASICLEQGVYHSFFGEKGRGAVLVGEVSMVNDDTTDNRFHTPLGRFSKIEEDESPLHLLAVDYRRYL